MALYIWAHRAANANTSSSSVAYVLDRAEPLIECFLRFLLHSFFFARQEGMVYCSPVVTIGSGIKTRSQTKTPRHSMFSQFEMLSMILLHRA